MLHTEIYEILSDLCPPGEYQKIEHTESYLSDLTEAFTAHERFEILLNDYVEKAVLVDGKMDSQMNTIGVDLRTPKLVFTEKNQIPPNKVLLKSVFHVLIAKKKDP